MNSQYIFCEGNLYVKNNPNYHKTCCKFASRSYSVHQALRLKWCLSGNPDTLKVTVPQGGTGTLQVIVVKQKESFFFIPAPLIGFAAKTASHLWWTWPCIGKYLEFFHSKTLLQALPRWWPSQLTWFLVLVHVKKTLLLSLWLAVFDSFLLKDSFNCHKT